MMAEVQSRNTNGASDAAHHKKPKGFWSNVFGRSSNAAHTDENRHADENKDDEQPKHNGFMDSVMTNARQAVTKEITNIAEDEVKEIKAQLNNTNGSQPANTTTAPSSGSDPSTTDPTTTASNALSATTNWAKRMADSAQQKVQSLQSLGS